MTLFMEVAQPTVVIGKRSKIFIRDVRKPGGWLGNEELLGHIKSNITFDSVYQLTDLACQRWAKDQIITIRKIPHVISKFK